MKLGRTNARTVIDELLCEIQLNDEQINRLIRENRQHVKVITDLLGDRPPAGPAVVLLFPRHTTDDEAA